MVSNPIIIQKLFGPLSRELKEHNHYAVALYSGEHDDPCHDFDRFDAGPKHLFCTCKFIFWKRLDHHLQRHVQLQPVTGLAQK